MLDLVRLVPTSYLQKVLKWGRNRGGICPKLGKVPSYNQKPNYNPTTPPTPTT
jgi:hypothetical protein